MTTLCPERELLPEYLTQRLDSTEAARVQEHVAGCETCRRLADELEIGLAALAIAREEALEHDRLAAATAAGPAATPSAPLPGPGSATPRSRRTRWIGLVAAACAALIIGGIAGAAIQESSEGPEVVFAFPLTSTSVIDPASGTGELSLVDGQLQIGLSLEGLPTDADYFECLWILDGEARSAGTFTAADGAADVSLVVAPFEGPPVWTLDIVAHSSGEEPYVVLTAVRA